MKTNKHKDTLTIKAYIIEKVSKIKKNRKNLALKESDIMRYLFWRGYRWRDFIKEKDLGMEFLRRNLHVYVDLVLQYEKAITN